MAGHSHAKTIKYRKGAQDAKRSKIFTKIQREITVSVKQGGADEAFNPKLRLARLKARMVNMPLDKIKDAIKRATESTTGGENYEECFYLGTLPGGLFILVKALTDNKNRTASDVRGILTKQGASMGEPSAIDFLFTNVGVIKYLSSKAEFEDVMEVALENDAEDVVEAKIDVSGDDADEAELEDAVEVVCEMKNFHPLRQALEEKFGEAQYASLEWRAKNPTNADSEQIQKIEKLIDILEDLDDVQECMSNIA